MLIENASASAHLSDEAAEQQGDEKALVREVDVLELVGELTPELLQTRHWLYAGILITVVEKQCRVFVNCD